MLKNIVWQSKAEVCKRWKFSFVKVVTVGMQLLISQAETRNKIPL
jgi:hypothetical protein